MPASRGKDRIITFKADHSLMDALRAVRNRSEFIRDALLAALQSACPLCGGSGILTPNQRTHWDAFARDHHLRRCHDCDEYHLACDLESVPPVHAGSGRRRRAGRKRGRTPSGR
jgi:hypothetical protein